MKRSPLALSPAAGFSLVELTVVVIILGLLTLMGVPRYQAAVERGKATEAYAYLAQVAEAQEMHHARAGRYADALGQLPIEVDAPQHFAVGALSSHDWQTRWSLRLTRRGATSGRGAYTVVFGQDGFDAARSSIPAALSPTGVGGGQSVTRGSGSSGGSGSGNAGNGPNPDAGNSDQENRGRGNGDGAGRQPQRGTDGQRGRGRGR